MAVDRINGVKCITKCMGITARQKNASFEEAKIACTFQELISVAFSLPKL